MRIRITTRGERQLDSAQLHLVGEVRGALKKEVTAISEVTCVFVLEIQRFEQSDRELILKIAGVLSVEVER